MENISRKFGLQINQKKDKIYDSGKKKQFTEKLNRTFENKKLQI
jgi:hypothetical protein